METDKILNNVETNGRNVEMDETSISARSVCGSAENVTGIMNVLNYKKTLVMRGYASFQRDRLLPIVQ